MTDRLLLAASLSAAFVVTSVPVLLPFLRRVAGQPIREDAPPRHREKAGTPTLGGLVVLGAAAVGVVGFGSWSPALGVAGAVVVAYAGIGLMDDWLGLRRGHNLGLRAREKLALQIPVALGVGWYVAKTTAGGTAIALPWGASWELGWAYVPFATVFVIGFANGVNLTDGLDGLAAGTVALSLGVYTLVASRSAHPELAALAAALLGGCLGFLWYNAHPAQLILGDVGAQSLGAALAALALLTKTEALLVVVGAVFVLEAASVVVQVAYFKLSGGRRVLRSSPLHHHFELVGWHEAKIVTRLWLVAVLAAAAGWMWVG